MKALKHLLLVAALSFLPGLSTARSQTTVPLNDQDKEFVKVASEGLCFEVQGGRIALANTGTAAVRRYGARMVRDHSRDFQVLSRIGVRIGVALSGTPNAEQVDTLKRFAAQNPLLFDQDYIRTAIQDHAADIRLYLKEAEDGLNPSLRKFATSRLPELFTHFQLAIITANVSGISIK